MPQRRSRKSQHRGSATTPEASAGGATAQSPVGQDPIRKQPGAFRRKLGTRRPHLLILLSLTFVLLCVLGLNGWRWILAGAGVLSPLIEDRLAGLVEDSAEVSVLDATFDDDGRRLVIRDIRVQIPGAASEAGDVASVELVEVMFAESGPWWRDREIARVIVHGPRLRISEHTSDGTLNLEPVLRALGGGKDRDQLRFRQWPDASIPLERVAELPELVIERASIEFGEHLADQWQLRTTFDFDGGIHRTAEDPETLLQFGFYEAPVQARRIANQGADGVPTDQLISDDVDSEDPESSADDRNIASSAKGQAADPTDSERERLRIVGELTSDVTRLTATLTGLRLNSERIELLPPTLRRWSALLQPSGIVDPVEFEWTADGQLAVDARLESIACSIPLPEPPAENDANGPSRDGEGASSDPGVPVREPDVHGAVRSDSSITQADAAVVELTNLGGAIRFDRDGVRLRELDATVDGVGYDIGGFLAFNRLRPQFDLQLRVVDFSLERNLNLLELLPERVRAEVRRELDQFAGKAGIVQAEVALAAPLTAADLTPFPNAPGRPGFNTIPSDFLDIDRDLQQQARGRLADLLNRLRVTGAIDIEHGEGMHSAFPYPLANVQGRIEFDEREVRIKGITAEGPGRASLKMRGRVSDLGPHPSFDLTVEAPLLPIDDDLRKVVGPTGREALDILFHERAYRGMLHEAVIREASTDEIRRLGELELLGIDVGNANTAPPPFRLGGDVELSARIIGPAGPDAKQQTIVYLRPAASGRPLGVMFEKFPNPGWLVSGEVRITDEDVVLTQDIVLQGVSGGDVRLTGHAVRGQTARGGDLDVYFDVVATRVPIDRVLIYSIPGRGLSDLPPGSEEFPLSPGGQWIAAIAPAGMVDLVGRLSPGPTWRTELDIVLTLRDGTIGADRHHIDDGAITDFEFRWPETYPLSDASGRATLNRDRLQIHRLAGFYGDEEIAASGTIDWTDESNVTIDLTFDGTNLDLAAHHIELGAGLINGAERDRIESFRREYGLGGRFDMQARMRRESEEDRSYQLDVWPRSLILNDAGLQRVVRMEPASGHLQITGDVLHIADLRGEAFEPLKVNREALDNADISDLPTTNAGASSSDTSNTTVANDPPHPSVARAMRKTGAVQASGTWSWMRAGVTDVDIDLKDVQVGSALLDWLLTFRNPNAAAQRHPRSEILSPESHQQPKRLEPTGTLGSVRKLIDGLAVQGQFGGRVRIFDVVDSHAAYDSSQSSGAAEISPQSNIASPVRVAAGDAGGFEATNELLADGPTSLQVQAAIQPQVLSFRLPDRDRMILRNLSGTLEIADERLVFDSLEGTIDEQVFTLDGPILRAARVDADIQIRADLGTGFNAWRPLIPEGLQEQLDSVGFDPGFDSAVEGLRIRLYSDAPPEELPIRLAKCVASSLIDTSGSASHDGSSRSSSVKMQVIDAIVPDVLLPEGAAAPSMVVLTPDPNFTFSVGGQLLLNEARADQFPVPLQRLRGVFDFEVRADGSDPVLTSKGVLRAPEVRIDDRILHDVQMDLVSASTIRRIIVPSFRGRIDGTGVIEGRGRFDLPDLTMRLMQRSDENAQADGGSAASAPDDATSTTASIGTVEGERGSGREPAMHSAAAADVNVRAGSSAPAGSTGLRDDAPRIVGPDRSTSRLLLDTGNASIDGAGYEFWLTAIDVDIDSLIERSVDASDSAGLPARSSDGASPLASSNPGGMRSAVSSGAAGSRRDPYQSEADLREVVTGAPAPAATTERQVDIDDRNRPESVDPTGRSGGVNDADTRGRLRASFSVVGKFGDPASRRGRGMVRVDGGTIYSVPLAVWVLQLSSLALPVSTGFDDAEVAFYIDGERVVFESIRLDSASIRLTGAGHVNATTRELSLALQTQSRMPAPILTPIWQTVRDTIFSLEVTGTIDSPKVRLRPRTPFNQTADEDAAAAAGRP